MNKIGSASFWKPDGAYTLPADLRRVGEYPDPRRGITLVIVEGPRLPSWVQGAEPWEFRSLAELIDYRRGSHP